MQGEEEIKLRGTMRFRASVPVALAGVFEPGKTEAPFLLQNVMSQTLHMRNLNIHSDKKPTVTRQLVQQLQRRGTGLKRRVDGPMRRPREKFGTCI